MTAPAKPFDLDAAVAEAEKRIKNHIARTAAQQMRRWRELWRKQNAH